MRSVTTTETWTQNFPDTKQDCSILRHVYCNTGSVFCLVYCNTGSAFCLVYCNTGSAFCLVCCNTGSAFCLVYCNTGSVFCLVYCNTVSAFCLVYCNTGSAFCLVYCNTGSAFCLVYCNTGSAFCLVYCNTGSAFCLVFITDKENQTSLDLRLNVRKFLDHKMQMVSSSSSVAQWRMEAMQGLCRHIHWLFCPSISCFTGVRKETFNNKYTKWT